MGGRLDCEVMFPMTGIPKLRPPVVAVVPRPLFVAWPRGGCKGLSTVRDPLDPELDAQWLEREYLLLSFEASYCFDNSTVVLTLFIGIAFTLIFKILFSVAHGFIHLEKLILIQVLESVILFINWAALVHRHHLKVLIVQLSLLLSHQLAIN
jgi:hypothetical protein